MLSHRSVSESIQSGTITFAKAGYKLVARDVSDQGGYVEKTRGLDDQVPSTRQWSGTWLTQV